MMGYKKIITYWVACTLVFLVFAAPIFQACEEQEEDSEVDQESSEGSSSSCEPSEPMSILDALIERYPVLDQIIEMILNLLYQWLSSYYTE